MFIISLIKYRLFNISIFFFFTIFNNITIYSDINYDYFTEITSINSDNNELLLSDFTNIDHYKLFYYYCLVSEENEYSSEYLKWFKKLENEIDSFVITKYKIKKIINTDNEKQKKFAEDLLKILHEKVFKKYKLHANKTSDLIFNGEYNCVNSSIIYSIFLNKYGLNNVAVETHDHVFIKVFLKNEEIDVETTNVYGFNPGNKKEVLDEFGRITGFNYVPQKDYKNRNDIGLKKLFLLVCYNLSSNYFKADEAIKAVKLSYIIKLGRNDKKGDEDFYLAFRNFIVDLSLKNKYLNAIYTINSYLINLEWDNELIRIRFDILHNYVVDWNDYDDYGNYKKFLIQENERFKKLKNTERFIEIYLLFTYKQIEYYLKINDFESAYKLLKEFNKNYKAQTTDIFINIIISELNYYKKNNKEYFIKERINQLKIDYNEYIDELIKYEINYNINNINILYKSNLLNDALKESNNLYAIYPDNDNVKQVLRNSYIKITIYFYNNDDYNNAIKYSDEGLKIFPDDKILKSNYKSFLNNFIYFAIEKEDYKKARFFINISKNKFPNSNFYSKAEKYLDKINY